MRLIFKKYIIILLLQSTVLAIGTQFLAIPRNTSDLILGYTPIETFESNNPIISVSYGNWLADMKISSMNYERNILGGRIGLDFRYISLNDFELRTERPTDDPLSYYNSSALSMDGKYTRQFKFGLLSTTLRYISLQLYNESSEGMAVDVSFSNTLKEDINVGIAILNLGYMSDLYHEKPQLPVRTILGASYNFEFLQFDNTLSMVIEKSSLVNGMIIRISDTIDIGKIQLLLGTQIANNATSLSGGINLKLGSYRFSYGVQIGTKALGIPQMLNLSMILP